MKRTRNKRLFITLFILVALNLLYSAPVYAADGEEEANQPAFLEGIYDSTGLDAFIEYTNSQSFIEMFGYSHPLDFIRDVLSGKLELSLDKVWQALKASAGSEIRGLVNIVIQVVVLGALCGLLQNASASYLSPKINDTAFYAVYLALGTILIKVYFDALENCTGVFGSLISFMNKAVPVFILLLSANGGIITGGLMSPALLFATNVITYCIHSFIIPLTSMLLILYFISNLLSDVDISYLTKFIKKATALFLDVSLTAFTAFVALEGITFASVDGVGVQAVKYAASSLVPVVGGFLSSSYDTITGFALVIKNSAGMLTMLVIASIAAIPVLKLFMVFLALKASAIIVQPFTEKRFSQFVDDASGCLLFVDLCMVVTGVLFIVITAMFMLLGNFLAMLR